MKRLLLLLLTLALGASIASAHELRPGYLQIRQSGAQTYDVLWKVPGRGEELRLGLYVEFSPQPTESTEPVGSFVENAHVERWSIRTEKLDGSTIHIAGLSSTLTDVLARIEWLDGRSQTARLTAASPTFAVDVSPSKTQVASAYTRLGVEHILTGFDHLLFVLALILLIRGRRQLLLTITAFTLAHSLTLAAATLGWVHVPQAPVEAVIALSIAFVAAEIVRNRRDRADGSPLSLAARRPWLIAFVFGLLHGLGFAGAMSEVGLPHNSILTALFFFNVGVELGQIAFVAAVLATLWAFRKISQRLPSTRAEWSALAPAYCIGGVAMYWTVERVAAF